MNNLHNYNLALFFTRGLSLKKWDKLGMLNREIRTYQELSKSFNNVYFFTYGSDDRSYVSILPKNIVIVEKPSWIPSNMYSILLPFIHYKKFKKIHIIKTNQMDGSWAAVIAKKMFGIKLVIRCGYEWFSFIEKGNRAFWKKVFAKFAEKISYTNANKIIITSDDDKDFIIKRFNIPHSKIEVIPNYIDTQKFSPQLVEKESDRILFLGRFEDQKNLFNLVRAMAGIQARLVMIGNGSQKDQLIKLAQENNVQLVFLGNISQDAIPKELCRSRIFILPSLYEGNPKALLEAMSCGLPCIGARSPGIQNIIKDGENGVLCGVDAPSIHESIKKVLNNQELSNHIGKGARDTIVSTFSLEKVLEKEINLHSSLVS